MTDPVYVATINIPGYLPEGDPFYANKPAECWEWLADERLRAEDATEDAGDEYSDTLFELRRRSRVAAMEPRASVNLGTVYGGTPGYGGDHDLGVAYSVDVTSDVRYNPETDEWESTADPAHVDYPHEPGRLLACEACTTGPCACDEATAPCASYACTNPDRFAD